MANFRQVSKKRIRHQAHSNESSKTSSTSMGLDALLLAKALSCLFLAILFLQSGLDKIIDKKGNLEWLTGHFAASPLKPFVGMMFATVMIVEVLAGLSSLAGVIGVFLPSMAALTVVGPALSCLALVMLFFGQRVAKDYPGAATLACYFCAALLTLVVCGTTKLP